MAIVALLINYNDEEQKLYIPLLLDNGITAHCAPSMSEALVMLVDTEYSSIAINGDNFDFLPLLKVMRKLTTAPIGVSVSRYDQEENNTAIQNGADIYRVRYDTAETRVGRFSNLAKWHVEYAKGQQRPMTVIAYDEIQVFPHTRKVYVQGAETRLMRKEFDILHYLITNQGIVISYEQIYRRVWGEDYPDNVRALLWNQMYRLRKKLQIAPDLPDYIMTERNFGYGFSPRKKTVQTE